METPEARRRRRRSPSGDSCGLEAAVRPDPIDERQPRADIVACDVEHLALFVRNVHEATSVEWALMVMARDAVGRRYVAQMLAERRLHRLQNRCQATAEARPDLRRRDIGTAWPTFVRVTERNFWHPISSSGHSHRRLPSAYPLPFAGPRPHSALAGCDSKKFAGLKAAGGDCIIQKN